MGEDGDIRLLMLPQIKMTAVLETEAHNLTEERDSFSQENQTTPHAAGQLNNANCLFLSIVPEEQTVSVLICFFVLLTALSCFVNALILFGLGQSEEFSWQPRFILLKNLIFSDLVQTATFGPAVVHSLIQRRTMAFSGWCYVQYFLGGVSVFCSLVTITCMALERYIYVCHAIHYLPIFTKIRLRGVLGGIWLYSVFIGVSEIVLLHTGRGEDDETVTTGLLCEPDVVEQHLGFPRASAVFRKTVGSLTLLLCLLIHAFSFFRMYQVARNAVIPFNAINVTARNTVLFYCGMLFLQLLPLLLKVASDALWEFRAPVAMMVQSSQSPGLCKVKTTPTATATALHISLLVMLIVPPCINPLVYGLWSVEMRQALTSRLRSWTERRANERAAERIRLEHVARRNGAQAG